MKYLHKMIRIKDVNESLRFICEGLNFKNKKNVKY